MNRVTQPARVQDGDTVVASGTGRDRASDEVVPFASCLIHPTARQAAVDVLASGWVTTGAECAAFEAELADEVGAAHGVTTASCTAALELSLRSMRLRPGTGVLVSTLTFCGAVSAIVHAGLQPVLVDVDPATGMPTPETVRAARDRTGSPRVGALMVVHWAGDPCDVAALADAAGVPRRRVVVDAAHALGSEWQQRPVGATDLTCFSFYATKNLPIGEGGMVTTHDADVAAWLRQARLHGMSRDAWRRYLPGGSWRYDVQVDGLKANMSDVQAAIGRAQLRQLASWQQRRARWAARYDEALASANDLRLPHRPAAGTGRHAWHLYPVQVEASAVRSRDEVVAALSHAGVGTSVHFIPVHRLTWFAQHLGVFPASFPGAEQMFARLISLPLHPHLHDWQVDHVVTTLLDALWSPTTHHLEAADDHR